MFSDLISFPIIPISFPPSVQNTVTNADKLLAASEELSHTGECNPEEIYQVAHELEDRMQKFLARVEKRQQLLDLSVSFHAHTQEILAWYAKSREDAVSSLAYCLLLAC